MLGLAQEHTAWQNLSIQDGDGLAHGRLIQATIATVKGRTPWNVPRSCR